MQTAEIIARPHDGLRVQTATGLRERHLGSLQGKRWPRGKPLPGDVESGQKFRARMADWFQAFLASHVSTAGTGKASSMPSTPERTIVIVSHGAWLSTFLGVLVSSLGYDVAPGVDTRQPCLNTSIMRVRCWLEDAERTTWRGEVLSWGEVQHLRGMMDEERLAVQDDV